MAFRLSEGEIHKRFIEWRNLKRLHADQKVRNQRLEAEVRELKAQLIKRDELIEKLLLRVADLEKKVYGGKNDKGNSSTSSKDSELGNQNKDRSSSSYQRTQPKDEEITDTEHHPVSACKHCGSQLISIEEVTRYVEDIILPQIIGKPQKIVIKHNIERGYCSSCGVWTSAKDLRGQLVSLGQNIKLLVTYLVTILDCSYEQVKSLTKDLYDLTLSDGEITNILTETAQSWLPEYTRLKEEIRAGPGTHVDETTWPIQIFSKHCYAWVISALNSTARIYKLATSRGKDHAIDLLGTNFKGVLISDCYGAYKKPHQPTPKSVGLTFTARSET